MGRPNARWLLPPPYSGLGRMGCLPSAGQSPARPSICWTNTVSRFPTATPAKSTSVATVSGLVITTHRILRSELFYTILSQGLQMAECTAPVTLELGARTGTLNFTDALTGRQRF